jgi:tetratricopeptide (TPR) repeat protein
VYIDEALKQLQEGFRIKKDDPQYPIDIAQTYMFSARLQWNTPKAAVLLAAAHEAMQTAAGIETPDSYYHQRLGELLLLEGRERMQRGSSPLIAFQKASNAFEASLKLNPNNPHAYLGLAELSRWQIQAGSLQNAEKHVDEGLKFIQSALSINPSLAEAYAIRGVLMSQLTKNQKDPQMKTTSRESIQKALEMNRNLQREYASFL